MDILVPSLPVCNIDQYDGNNWQKRRYLEQTKPVGWLEEWKKSPNMRAANAFPESKRSVRLDITFYMNHYFKDPATLGWAKT